MDVPGCFSVCMLEFLLDRVLQSVRAGPCLFVFVFSRANVFMYLSVRVSGLRLLLRFRV